MNERNEIPAYLQRTGDAEHYYGTLSYNRRSRCWTIKGEPCVTEMAKRLFPGCEGHGRGEARFTAHRRIVGDLNWLMLRYPLRVSERDEKRWEEALTQAQAYAAQRLRAQRMPQSVTPPEAYFEGALRPFQKEGLAWLLANPRALLADEMGLGKTVEAIAFLATTRLLPVMLVVPSHLVRNWERELQRFLKLPGGLRVHVIRGLTPYELPVADVYIVHYLLLRGWKEVLPRLCMQSVIFDEIQELRHAGTEKYSAASLLAEQVCQGERQATGLSKAPFVAAFVRALLEGGERVLLFAHHHQVMDRYRTELHAFHPVFITGRETQDQKDQAAGAFMSGKTNLCCVSLRAAAGLNLQRATCVVFGELDWSPAVHSQAEDRAHRIGQEDSLLCYYLVSPRGSDQDMQEALGLKVSQFIAIMGDGAPDPSREALASSQARAHMERLVARLMERAKEEIH